jgi:outer membrane protein assembly factor BamE (lipoprotein component of BamABCDE complex)
MPIRIVIAVVGALALAGCAIERAKVAQDAKTQMVGMTKEQVLACMGPPPSRLAEGSTEVWS